MRAEKKGKHMMRAKALSGSVARRANGVNAKVRDEAEEALEAVTDDVGEHAGAEAGAVDGVLGAVATEVRGHAGADAGAVGKVLEAVVEDEGTMLVQKRVPWTRAEQLEALCAGRAAVAAERSMSKLWLMRLC